MDEIAAAFADCDTAATAVVTTSLAFIATALAVSGIVLAYVIRQINLWRRTGRDD